MGRPEATRSTSCTFYGPRTSRTRAFCFIKNPSLPLKEEYFDKRGTLYKVFTAEEIKEIKGFPTIVKRTMKNLQSGHSTETVFSKVDYNIGIKDSLFTERYLKQPPKKWLD